MRVACSFTRAARKHTLLFKETHRPVNDAFRTKPTDASSDSMDCLTYSISRDPCCTRCGIDETIAIVVLLIEPRAG